MTLKIFGLTIALLAPMILAYLGKRFIKHPFCLAPHLLGLLVYIAIVASVIASVFYLEHKTLISLGIRPLSWQTIMWGAGLTVLFVYVFAPVAYWFVARLNLGNFDAGIAKNDDTPTWFLTISVIVGGISEEILYRGYSIDRMAMLTGSIWIACLITVLIYGFAHVPMWGWGPALTTIVSGGVFALFFVIRHDLSANIIAHVATDLIGIVVMPLIGKKKQEIY